MSKVAEPVQVVALDQEVRRLEQRFDIPVGTTELAPNVESARGIMQTYAIAKASERQPDDPPGSSTSTSRQWQQRFALERRRQRHEALDAQQ